MRVAAWLLDTLYELKVNRQLYSYLLTATMSCIVWHTLFGLQDIGQITLATFCGFLVVSRVQPEFVPLSYCNTHTQKVTRRRRRRGRRLGLKVWSASWASEEPSARGCYCYLLAFPFLRVLLLHTFCARQTDVVVVAAVVIVLSRCVDAFGPIHRRVSQLLFHVFLSRFFSFVFHSQALVSATFATSATFLCTLYSYCTAYDLSPTSNRSSKKHIRAEAPTLQAPLERERGKL